MGLDINAIKVEFIDHDSVPALELMTSSVEEFHINDYFMEHHEDLKEYIKDDKFYGLIDSDNEFTFRAGSYGTYGDFRRRLCVLVHDISIAEFWEKGEEIYTLDFGYLLNFSDSQGIIGPAACKRLLQDFIKWDDLVYEAWRESPLMYGVYRDFKKAVEIGSNGLVIFC